jgi:integrase
VAARQPRTINNNFFLLQAQLPSSTSSAPRRLSAITSVPLSSNKIIMTMPPARNPAAAIPARHQTFSSYSAQPLQPILDTLLRYSLSPVPQRLRSTRPVSPPTRSSEPLFNNTTTLQANPLPRRSRSANSFELFTPPQVFTMLTQKDPAILRHAADETPLQGLRTDALVALRKMWADSTWSNRISLVNRLEKFRQQHPALLANTSEALDWAIMLFAQSTGAMASSKLTYVKHLSALYHRQEHQLPLCSMYATALRSQAAVPMHQARPATTDQIDRMLDRAAADTPRLRTAIFVAWKTASRWDEVSRLTKESFILVTEREIVVEWMCNTKTTRLDPFRSSTWTVIAHDAPMTEHVDTIQGLAPSETLTSFSTSQFVDWMQRDAETKYLTAQSIKRGALTHLVTHALNNTLDITLIPRLAKHKMTVDALPATTFRYLADRVSLARLMKTQDATIHLPCAPYRFEPAEDLFLIQNQQAPQRREIPPRQQQLHPLQQQQQLPINSSIMDRVRSRRNQQQQQQLTTPAPVQQAHPQH